MKMEIKLETSQNIDMFSQPAAYPSFFTGAFWCCSPSTPYFACIFFN
jgi:hypothetical protein